MEWIKKQVSDHWLELIMLGLTSWAIIWAFLESLGPWIIVIGFALVGIGLLIINQLHTIRARRKKGLANLNDQEIRKTIRDWLDVPYLSIEPKVYPDKFLHFDVTGKHGIPVTVERLRTDPYRLNLGVKVNWEEEAKVKLQNLREPLRSNLINNLRIEMLRLGIQFVMSGQPFEEIVLIEQIPLDNSLTSFYFLQRIFFVVRAAKLIMELTELGLRETLPSELIPDKKDSQTEQV